MEMMSSEIETMQMSLLKMIQALLNENYQSDMRNMKSAIRAGND